MPISVVKTKKQEQYWKRAKRQVEREYPDIPANTDRYYRLVMSIYKNMSGYKPKGQYGAKRGAGKGRGMRGGGRRNRNRGGCARGRKGYGRGGGRGRRRYRLG